MKTLRIVCPTCGAHLDVDTMSGQARCRFCKEIFQIGGSAQDDAMNGAEQMGYDFERGRQRANVEFTQGFADRVAEARQHMPAMDPEPAYVPDPVYVPAPAPAPAAPARSEMPVWLLALLLIIAPPVGFIATVVTLVRKTRRSNGGNVGLSGIIFLVFWITLSAMVMIAMLD